MDIDDIITEFGAYYINQGQNMARLVKLLHVRSLTDQAFTQMLTDETIWRSAKASFERVLQPFQKAFTPIAKLTFTPVEIRQFQQKIDTEEYPSDLEATWLGFLTGDDIDPAQWPFIRWFIEVFLLPQAEQDYELNEVYGGSYVNPTPGTPGAAGTAMDGIKKLINGHVASGRITPIVTGALSADNATFVDQIEFFVDSINQNYQGIPMQLVMGQTRVRKFLRGYRDKYGQNANFSDSNGKVDFTNVSLLGVPSHNSTQKIWCTPKNNAVKLGKKTQNMKKVKIQSDVRLVKLFSDWFSGIGFIIPEVVFTNDQDLV